MESSNTDYLIVPKEEMLDDLVIPDHCEDDTDGVIPKEELFETSLRLEDALNEPNVDMVMPIKTELILCENIAQLRRQYESAEHGSVSDQDVFTGDISAEINRKWCEDSSVHAACAATSEALIPKKYYMQCQRGRTAEKLERLSCNVCENQFENRSALIIHMRTHTGEKPHSCDLCQKKFMHSSSLKVHMRTHTGEKPYFCDLCQKKFSRSSILLSHMRTHTGEKPYSCEVCQKKFAWNGYLLRHMKIHTGEKAHSCKLCQKKFIQKCNLATHMRTHTREKPYLCELCQNKFPSSSKLLMHMGTHNGEKPNSCDLCQKKFRHSSSLIYHMRTHSGEKPYSCDLCQKKIMNLSTLMNHMRSHTGEKPYSCELCQKKFSRSRILLTHMRTHTGEKPYSCERCQKKFSYKSGVNRHMRINTQENFGSSNEKQKLFFCNVCEKKFEWRCEFFIHMRTHTGEKQYLCELCQKKFTHSSILLMHMRTHTDVYCCEFCPKTYARESSLKKHMRIHTEENAHSCDLCPKKFADSYLLFIHNLETHIEEKFGSLAEKQKRFPCNVCVKHFISKSALDIHIRTHTGEKPNSSDLCENKFASTNLLIMHNLGTHIEEKFGSSAEKQKLFPCNVCQRQFIWRSALDNHMRTHTGEISNTRDLCENEFASKNLVVMHSLGTHIENKFGSSAEKQKLFPCNVCQRQFIWRSALDNHMRTHTGE